MQRTANHLRFDIRNADRDRPLPTRSHYPAYRRGEGMFFNGARRAGGAFASGFRAINTSPTLAKVCFTVSAGVTLDAAYRNYSEYSKGNITGNQAAANVGWDVVFGVLPGAAALKAPVHAARIAQGAVAAQAYAGAVTTDGFRINGGPEAAEELGWDLAATVIDTVSRGSLGSAVVAAHRGRQAMAREDGLRVAVLDQMRVHSHAASLATSSDGFEFAAKLALKVDQMDGRA